jgi:hypothetical protein
MQTRLLRKAEALTRFRRGKPINHREARLRDFKPVQRIIPELQLRGSFNPRQDGTSSLLAPERQEGIKRAVTISRHRSPAATILWEVMGRKVRLLQEATARLLPEATAHLRQPTEPQVEDTTRVATAILVAITRAGISNQQGPGNSEAREP